MHGPLRTTTPGGDLTRRVEALERRIDALGTTRAVRPAAPPRFDRLRPWWPARTVAWSDDDPTYPAPPANKFRVEFLDLGYTPSLSEAWEEFARDPRVREASEDDSPRPVAGNLSGCYLPEGTLCWVTRRKPTKELADAGQTGELWIVKHELVMELLIQTPSGGIPARGDTLGRATCDVQVPTPDGDVGAEDFGGDYSLANPQSFSETIYNVVDAEVAGGKVGKAAREGYAGLLIVDLESCGGS